ncbi:MAG: DUF4282 domain-containing protein [Firmicutes bacterium]|nr:DUF4282 domain-containing protein [Bacillota bacterium]
MKFRDLFNFDKMLTPLIIKILYYIGVAGSVIGGIVMFFGGFVRAFASGGNILTILGSMIGGMLGGILIIFLGVLMARIYSELMIVLFQIYQNLTAIKKKVVDDAKVVNNEKVVVDDVKVVVEDKPFTE